MDRAYILILFDVPLEISMDHDDLVVGMLDKVPKSNISSVKEFIEVFSQITVAAVLSTILIFPFPTLVTEAIT